MIEAGGKGIEGMLDACETAGIPAPEFQVESTGLGVTLLFGEAFTQDTTQETAQETTQETTQEKILALLRADPVLTRRELAKRIGMTENGIKYQLSKLKSAKIIWRVGSTKAGQWKVLK